MSDYMGKNELKTTGEPELVAAYCRVSTKKEEQLDSLENQREYMETLINRSGNKLYKIYADEGVSGTKLKNRDALLQLLEDAKKGCFKKVIVKDISRLARNLEDFLSIARQLLTNGVELYCASLNSIIRYTTMEISILALMAQEESNNLSRRVKFSKRLNMEKGKVPNFVYGYDKTPTDLFNLTINKEESEIVKRIFRMYLEEGYGANKIAYILNGEGIKTKRGCNWSQNAISRILQNEIYIGRIINGKESTLSVTLSQREKQKEKDWIVTENEKLAIIHKEDFEKVQQLLKQRREDYNLNKKNRLGSKHLFSTLIKCKHCGYSFSRQKRVYSKEYVRWVCSGRYANPANRCINQVKIDEQELKDIIKAILLQIVGDKDKFKEDVRKEFDKQRKNNNKNIKSIKGLEKSKKEITKQIDREKIMFREGITENLEELNERITPLKAELRRIETDIKLLEPNQNITTLLNKQISSFFKSAETLINMDDVSNGNLKQIIDRIEVDSVGNIEIYFKLGGFGGKPVTVQLLDDCTNIRNCCMFSESKSIIFRCLIMISYCRE